MSLFTRFVIIVTIVVSITDTVVFWHIMRGPAILTWQLVILTIIITIIPIVVNLWYWLVMGDTKWKHLFPWDKNGKGNKKEK